MEMINWDEYKTVYFGKIRRSQRDFLFNLITKEFQTLHIKDVPAELRSLCLAHRNEDINNGLERLTFLPTCGASGVESITGLGAKEEYQIQNDTFSVLMRKPENHTSETGSYILKYSKVKSRSSTPMNHSEFAPKITPTKVVGKANSYKLDYKNLYLGSILKSSI